MKSLRYGGSLAACGLVASPTIPATVLPFILRHVNLLGIDSVQWPLAEKKRLWGRLAKEWQLPSLETLVEPLSLETCPMRWIVSWPGNGHRGLRSGALPRLRPFPALAAPKALHRGRWASDSAGPLRRTRG